MRNSERAALALLAVLVTTCMTLISLVVVTKPETAKAQTHIGGLPWTCSLDNIGATLTICQQNLDTQQRLFITDIVAQSADATGGQFILQYGTGTNCGTGTTSLFPSQASVVRWGNAGNTAAPTMISLHTPLIVPAGKDLCALGVATHTLTIQIFGEKM